MQICRAQEDLNKMSWADMCETRDGEEDEPIYGDLNEEKTTTETEMDMSTEDKLECGEIKENDPETLETVESMEDSSAATEEVEYWIARREWTNPAFYALLCHVRHGHH